MNKTQTLQLSNCPGSGKITRSCCKYPNDSEMSPTMQPVTQLAKEDWLWKQEAVESRVKIYPSHCPTWIYRTKREPGVWTEMRNRSKKLRFRHHECMRQSLKSSWVVNYCVQKDHITVLEDELKDPACWPCQRSALKSKMKRDLWSLTLFIVL